MFQLLILIFCSLSTIAKAEDWQAIIMPDIGSASLNNESRLVIEDALFRNFRSASIDLISPALLLNNCDDSICEPVSLRTLLSAHRKNQGVSNLLVLYKVSLLEHDGQGKTTLSIRAFDPLSGALSFANTSSTQLYELKQQSQQNTTLSAEGVLALDIDTLTELMERGSQKIATEISRSKKRYVYKLTLNGFTPDEVNIFSGIAMSGTDNVKARLIKEETKQHFLNTFLPSKNLQFELATVVSPSQFREQMSRLFSRMNVDVNSRFIQQENLFETTRTQSPYTLQLFVLWSVLVMTVLVLSLIAFWTWAQFKLNIYGSNNQSKKWVLFVRKLQFIPISFLCKKKWKQQLPYWEKRVNQADIWYDNAHQLLQNNEIESANVFVNKALEVDASNIAAQALESAISEKLSKHQIIDDERVTFKAFVKKAIEYAQSGNTYKGLEQAYLGLELCESHISSNRPVIDLQIDSTKNLIKRIAANKSHHCVGLKLYSSDQRVHINRGDSLRIGRSDTKVEAEHSVDLSFPQDTLSRVHKSILVSRQEQGFSVSDIGSTNGLWLQYKRCERDKEYLLTQFDQLHLAPPDDLASLGLEVSQLLSNKSVCFRLCQNASLPTMNMSSLNSFINPAEYAKDIWYLSQESFYLVYYSQQYTWFSESEWQAQTLNKEVQNKFVEVLKLDMSNGVWLHLPNQKSSSVSSQKFEVKIDDARILGPVPLPINSQVSVNNYLLDIALIPGPKLDSEVTEMLRG